MYPQLNFMPWGVFVVRFDPQQIIQTNFSVNKTIPMKQYTEDFICKDHAVYCIILNFCWSTHCRSMCSACCIHIYIIIGHALLLIQSIQTSLWASGSLPLCLSLNWTPHDALFCELKYINNITPKPSWVTEWHTAWKEHIPVKKVFMIWVTHWHFLISWVRYS